MGIYAITGAASGIGAATRAALEVDGHSVIGVDLSGSDIDADLGTSEGRSSAVAAVAATTDSLDGVVPCAGLAGLPGRSGALLASVNYFGTVELLAALRPLLAEAEAPAVVAVSSNSTTTSPGVAPALVEACLAGDEAKARDIAEGVGSLATYPSTKTAIAHWVRRQAVTADWIGAGINLNAIAPGLTDTAMVAETRNDPTIGKFMDAYPVPIGRPGTPEEIAAAIMFLLGPGARFFCGSVVFADGGTDALLRSDAWPAPIG